MNEFMRIAVENSLIAYKYGDVPVGAVIVKGDEIIASTYNKKNIDNVAVFHAEILAIIEACKKLGSWYLNDCDIYVTMEPCPMCMGAIINSRIKNVYFGVPDEKAGACGSIVNLTEYKFNHIPQYEGGILKEDCKKILQKFFQELRERKKKSRGANIED